MKKTYITITHLEDFRASSFVNPGEQLVLKKTPNEYSESVKDGRLTHSEFQNEFEWRRYEKRL